MLIDLVILQPDQMGALQDGGHIFSLSLTVCVLLPRCCCTTLCSTGPWTRWRPSTCSTTSSRSSTPRSAPPWAAAATIWSTTVDQGMPPFNLILNIAVLLPSPHRLPPSAATARASTRWPSGCCCGCRRSWRGWRRARCSASGGRSTCSSSRPWTPRTWAGSSLAGRPGSRGQTAGMFSAWCGRGMSQCPSTGKSPDIQKCTLEEYVMPFGLYVWIWAGFRLNKTVTSLLNILCLHFQLLQRFPVGQLQRHAFVLFMFFFASCSKVPKTWQEKNPSCSDAQSRVNHLAFQRVVVTFA